MSLIAAVQIRERGEAQPYRYLEVEDEAQWRKCVREWVHLGEMLPTWQPWYCAALFVRIAKSQGARVVPINGEQTVTFRWSMGMGEFGPFAVEGM